MIRARRTALLAAVTILIGVLLSGCSLGGHPATPPAPQPEARSMEAVEAAVDDIPGVRFTAARAWDGTTSYVTATLSASDTFTGDPAALIDYALGQLASQTEIDRGRLVRFTFDTTGQTVDTTRAFLASLDIASERYADGSSLELSSSDLDRRYGTWPAPAPERPPTL